MQPNFFNYCAFVSAFLCFPVFSGFSQSATKPDSITVAIAPEYDKVSKSHRTWFGENYRKLWATPVTMRVIQLNEEKGGMKILKKGGGQQTKSLRLQDPTGKEWALRSIQKDPEMALPEKLRPTVARHVVQDQISAAHPYGVLVVPPLAEALNLYHPKVEVVYLPDQPALGEYRQEFANQVYLLEEREPTGVADTDGTDTVLEKLQKDNGTLVNQRMVLRARLLDFIVADWDRHEDQWRWVEKKEGTGDYYEPMPRDRDQIFFTNEGIIPKIGSRSWIMPKFQGFDAKVRDIEGFNYNARHFDRQFLSSLSRQDWETEIAYVQQNLTDAVIDRALHRMPANIHSVSGEEIKRIMIARRNSLNKVAMTYYEYLAEAVDIPASDEREQFELKYNADETLTVSVYALKKSGETGHLMYQRIFDPETTKEVRLYGRGGDDVFYAGGPEESEIKVRMIGGDGNDQFVTAPDFRNKRKLIIYDREDQPNNFTEAKNARIRTANDTIVNSYNPDAYKPDVLMPRAMVGYNLDDGVILGAGFVYTKHGFRKEPYASRHKLMVGKALATNATFFEYSGYFTGLIGKNSLSVELDGRAPNNTSNFFGIGNETEFIEEGKRPVLRYRNRYNLVESEVKLHRNLGPDFEVHAGVAGQYYSADSADNAGRFLTIYNQQQPEEQVFTKKFFAGLVAGFTLDTRDDAFVTTHGVLWKTSLTGLQQFDDQEKQYGQVTTEFSFYINPPDNSNFVVANRFGGGTTFGDPNFYQLLYLGGNSGLRGFRNFRFAGESMAYHNLELRIKLFDFTSYLLPGSVGLIGFNDLGRVWANGEDSNSLHHGYGAGFYVIPSQLILLQAAVGISKENVLPFVSMGFRF